MAAKKLQAQEVSVNLKTAMDILYKCRKAELRKGNRITPMMWGPPGQGKTAIVDQLCERFNDDAREARRKALELETGAELPILTTQEILELPIEQRPWRVQAFRLSQCDPTDLKGVPVYLRLMGSDGKEYEFTSFAPPATIPIVGKPETAEGYNIILFMDEVPQATPTMQNLSSNIIDGKVGDHQIDIRRCYICAAGNRREDMAATFEMPKNVGNRILHLHTKTEFPEWEMWAVSQELHPYVIGYLKDHLAYFNEPPREDVLVYGTPRSWHKVSDMMLSEGDNFFEDDITSLVMLNGLVGPGKANEFWQFCRMTHKQYSINKIMSGEKPKTPDDKSVLFSLAVHASMIINKWAEEIKQEKKWLNASAEGQDQATIDILGKERVSAINNVYTWFIQPDIDPSFSVLLNRYQNKAAQTVIRPCQMSHKDFEPCRDAYAVIHRALKVTR